MKQQTRRDASGIERLTLREPGCIQDSHRRCVQVVDILRLDLLEYSVDIEGTASEEDRMKDEVERRKPDGATGYIPGKPELDTSTAGGDYCVYRAAVAYVTHTSNRR